VFPFSGRTLNRYFLDASNNRFLWSRAAGGVVGPYRITMTQTLQQTQYPMDNGAGISAVLSLIAPSMNVNWSQFDSNNDGKITADELGLLIVHNGAGAGNREISPSGCWTPSGSTVSICGDSHRVSTASPDFGMMTHELTHQLGPIDLYGPWGKPTCWNQGLTAMSCTGNSVLNLDPWHKLQLGWSEPRIRTLGFNYSDSLPATQSLRADAPIILYDPNHGTGEYFLRCGKRR
jgi:M6 family metalloprotease-like protein